MTKEQILQKHFLEEFGHDGHGKFMQYILDAMEEYSQMQIKKMNIPSDIVELPINHICKYSRAMNQSYPRKCIECGKPEETQHISSIISSLLKNISVEQNIKLNELSYCFGNKNIEEHCLFITTKFGNIDRVVATYILNDMQL